MSAKRQKPADSKKKRKSAEASSSDDEASVIGASVVTPDLAAQISNLQGLNAQHFLPPPSQPQEQQHQAELLRQQQQLQHIVVPSEEISQENNQTPSLSSLLEPMTPNTLNAIASMASAAASMHLQQQQQQVQPEKVQHQRQRQHQSHVNQRQQEDSSLFQQLAQYVPIPAPKRHRPAPLQLHVPPRAGIPMRAGSALAGTAPLTPNANELSSLLLASPATAEAQQQQGMLLTPTTPS